MNGSGSDLREVDQVYTLFPLAGEGEAQIDGCLALDLALADELQDNASTLGVEQGQAEQ